MKGRYQPIPLETDGSLFSRVTGLRFRPDGEGIRLIDPAASKVYQSRTEADAALRAAEEKLVRLRAELDRLRGRS